MSGTPSTFYIGDYSDEYIIKEGDMLVGMDGNFNLRKWKSRNGLLCQRTCKIESKDESVVLNNYLYHILVPLFKRIEDKTPSGSVKHLSARTINNISIPLPPLTIQREIVSVLDSFSTLIDKMKQEVELRKKQMEYMIKRLCSNVVERVRLDSLLDYEQPTRYIVNSTEYDSKYSIPVLTAGQSFILGYTNEEEGIYKASPQNPTIIFDDFTTGFHWVDFDFKVKSSAMKMLKLIESKKENNFRYIYMAMKTIDYIPTNHTRHWISIYSKFEIPLPPLSTQRSIVSTLDAFEQYISKLERLITLREKQYAYYREKLLTFE